MCLKGRWKFLSENFWKLNGPYIAGSFGGLREPLATPAIHVVARSCYLLHSWYRTATQYHIYHHASEVGRTHRLYAVRHRDLRVVLDCRKNPSTAPGLPRLASVAPALRHRLSPRANASLTAVLLGHLLNTTARSSSSAVYWARPRRAPDTASVSPSSTPCFLFFHSTWHERERGLSMQRAGPKVRSAVCRDRSIEDSRAPLQQHRFRVLQPPPTASSTSTGFCINHAGPAYGCICNHHYRRCQVASSLLFSSRSPRRLICIPPSK